MRTVRSFMSILLYLDFSSTELVPPPSPPQLSLRGGEALELDDPKLMLAEVGRDCDSSTNAAVRCEEDDLELLYSKLTSMLSASQEEKVQDSATGLAPPSQFDSTRQFKQTEQDKTSRKPKAKLDREIIPYVIALQLERAGTDWDNVRRQTEYLFSKGPNGYRAVAEKEAFVEKALSDLNTIIDQSLKEESLYRAAEEEASISCRLIVTNLAADAGEEEVAYVFHEYRRDM
jgi:hypothetical protein